MTAYRQLARLLEGTRTSDGAGVKLTRMFSHGEAVSLDPFLMLDHFGSDKVEDYIAGFPMHPHRGIETVTYMLDGYVDHEDSLGNKGTIGPGDLQWMTAGRGILHQEMPRRVEGWMRGFQLWVNLPRASKMMSPRYRDVGASSIPTVDLGHGSRVKVISGEFEGVQGPVKDLTVEVEYLDLLFASRTILEHEIPSYMSSFLMVYDGAIKVGEGGKKVPSGSLAVLGPGDKVRIEVGNSSAKLLLVSGKPLREPIAWGGPIVMNTHEELDQAFSELRKGTFIKKSR